MNTTPAPTGDNRLNHGHTPEEIRQRLAEPYQHSYLRDVVYGAVDGTITTFAVVSGVAGAELDARIVIILGAANLIGDGFSMACGNFLGTRAEQQEIAQTRRNEERHIDQNPDGEREEIRQIFAAKGFSDSDLERVVDVITADRKQWIETMLTDEYGLSLEGAQPGRAATVTFLAFFVAGLIPMLPFLLPIVTSLFGSPYLVSCVLTGVTFFLIGALKSRFVEQHWIGAGLETFAVGSIAAGLAFLVGVLLKGIG